MQIGFISPSFRALEVNWDLDYEMVKLGVPTVMGHMYRAGHRDGIRHWDFDAQVCDLLLEDPSAFDLNAYFNKELTLGFLRGTDLSLQAQTEKLLDTSGVIEREVFGISLSAVLDRIINVNANISLAQCLAVVLKQRYPRCTIVLGGLQVSPETLHEQYYRDAMEECPQIDYAFIGADDRSSVQLFRNITRGQPARCKLLGKVLLRELNEDGTSKIVSGQGADLDPDLLTQTSIEKNHPAHSRSGAIARLSASREVRDAEAASCEPTSGTVPLVSLLRGRPTETDVRSTQSVDVPHPYDIDEPDASKAGPQEYEKLTAMTPIFDKQLVESFRYSGAQIMKRFRFSKEQLLKYSRYENDTIVVLPHIFVKGCNAPCGFCSYAYTKITGEDAEETVAGLAYLAETYNCRHFHFLNTQINSIYQYCESFCDAIIRAKLDILWSDCANMRQLDEKLLEKMRRAGAMRLVFGIESPENEMLKYIRKGITVDKIERLLKASHELGIWNHILLIAGMPHETVAKQDRMMDFLVRTAPTVDFYSVSSFYLIANSPWGREPEKFGIDRTSLPGQLLEQQAFNEVPSDRWTSDGLKWPAKKQQIIDSTQRFYRTISQAKGQSRCVGGNIDLYLLMFLYSVLGHDRKDEIVQVYADTADRIGHRTDRSYGADAATVRINIPLIVGRMNEGDQSQLVQIPLDIVAFPVSEDRPHFCRSERYTFGYKNLAVDDPRFARGALRDLKDRWPELIGRLGKILGPFVQALDARMAPTTPERMAELVAKNLPRYKPWMNEGYVIVDTARASGRTVMERNLQWSGLVQ